jgi:branched-chain amino acid transport system ATP-binding protein
MMTTQQSGGTGPGAAGEILLEARAVSAGYGALAAVRNLDLQIRAGEVVALLGANGAGKTTTMLTLAGELPPLAGEVGWQGARVSTPLFRRARAGLGLVTEERSVFMKLTARENLSLGAGGVDRAVELFPELADHLDRRAGLLSGGQQQMLTLARALAARPKVLLADELSLGLAPLIVRRLLTAVQQAARGGVGVLLVEQHVRQALSIADRVYVLQRGRTVFEGDAGRAAAEIDQIEKAYLEGRRGVTRREEHVRANGAE